MEEMVERIRELCKKRGTSITKLEVSLGFANGTIGKWAKGKRQPPLEKLILIANKLETTVDYIASGVEESLSICQGQIDKNLIAVGYQKKIPPPEVGSGEDAEYLTLMHRLPEEERAALLAYLRARVDSQATPPGLPG